MARVFNEEKTSLAVRFSRQVQPQHLEERKRQVSLQQKVDRQNLERSGRRGEMAEEGRSQYQSCRDCLASYISRVVRLSFVCACPVGVCILQRTLDKAVRTTGSTKFTFLLAEPNEKEEEVLEVIHQLLDATQISKFYFYRPISEWLWVRFPVIRWANI